MLINLAVKNLCTVRFNAKAIPKEAIERLWSSNNSYFYYKVKFDAVIYFMTTLQFKVMYKGKVIGSGEADYF